MTREKLGSLWIDTATVIVGEPCALIADRRGDGPPIEYIDFVGLWREQGTRVPDPMAEQLVRLSEQLGKPVPDDMRDATQVREADHITVRNAHGTPGAFAVRTLENCDGWAAVYLERDKDGRPRRLIVDLNTKVEP